MYFSASIMNVNTLMLRRFDKRREPGPPDHPRKHSIATPLTTMFPGAVPHFETPRNRGRPDSCTTALFAPAERQTWDLTGSESITPEYRATNNRNASSGTSSHILPGVPRLHLALLIKKYYSPIGELLNTVNL